jgi:hypothetical protein
MAARRVDCRRNYTQDLTRIVSLFFFGAAVLCSMLLCLRFCGVVGYIASELLLASNNIVCNEVVVWWLLK